MPERQYRIHPAIGIARVGDAARSDASNDFYFVGPEIPEFAANVDPQSGAQGEFKTSDGKVKPQAARFRIFEYEKGNDGKFHPIGEDNPLFSSYGTLRNPTVRNDKLKTNAERKKWLELDPGPQRVNGGDTVTVAHLV